MRLLEKVQESLKKLPALEREAHKDQGGRSTTFGQVVLVFATFWFVFVATASSAAWLNDGWVRFLVARNLLRYGDPILREAESGDIAPLWAVEGRDGHLYSFYGLGHTLVMIPFHALSDWIDVNNLSFYIWDSHRFLLQMIGPLEAALLGLAIFCAARSMRFRVRSAFAVAAVVSFATMIWPHSRDLQDHLQETALITGSLAMALVSNHRSSRWAAVASGALFGFAIVTRTSAVLAGPGLLVVLFAPCFISGKRREAAWTLTAFVCGIASTVWIWPLYNVIRFGNPFDTGYGQAFARHQPTPVVPNLRDVAKWLISPWHGILIYVPATLLVPVAAPRLLRRNPWVFIGGMLTFVAYIMFYASFHDLGYWSYGPNYTMPAIPWVVLMMTPLFEDWQALSRGIKALMIVVLTVSLLAQLPGVIVPTVRHWYLMDIPFDEQVVVWQWEHAPIVGHARESVVLIGNALSGRSYDLIPGPDMVHTFVELNVPDWWWLFVVYRGFRPALVIPILLLGMAGYAAGRVLRRSGLHDETEILL